MQMTLKHDRKRRVPEEDIAAEVIDEDAAWRLRI
jgi:hypothetical protein